jgi:peptidoglycan/LPS O-acetylase OafA/YrhL
VVIAAIIAGWFILLPDEFQLLGKSVLAGATFLSNILSWQEVGYFNAVAELKPLLHLWSLGVEEQYYIIWPVLVVFIWKRSQNFLLIVLPILFGSFLVNIYAVDISPSATFYLPVTRVWELMLGSLLAYIDLNKIDFFAGKISCNVISFLGLCLLLIGFIVIDAEKSFPGYWALLPTVGAFLIILAGKDGWINSIILSNKAIVFIGLISYPLYLWHWPLLVYSKIVGFADFYDNLLILFTSFILAYLTYILIEKTLRNFYIFLVISMIALAILGSLMFAGYVQSFHNSDEIKRISHAAGEWDYPGKMEPFKYKNRTFYRIKNSKQNRLDADEVVFIGDSNMEQYYPNLDELSSKTNKSIVFATQGGCIPIPNVHHDKRHECDELVDDVLSYVSGKQVKTVVISALWYVYFDKDSMHYIYNDRNSQKYFLIQSDGRKLALKSFEILLRRLNEQGKKTYVLLNIPIGEEFSPINMINRSLVSGKSFFQIKYNDVSTDSFKRYRYIDSALIDVSGKSNAVVIDPKMYLCNEKRCPSISDDGEPIYKDTSHLRPSFVRTNVQFLDETLQ